MAAKRKVSPPIVAPQPVIHRPHWRVVVPVWVQAITAVGAAVAAAFYLNANVARPILESGPLPVPARTEVQAVAAELEAAKKADADVRMRVLQRLEALGKSQEQLAEWQQNQIADTLTSRLRNLQASIDVATTRFNASRSPDDQRVLETLLVQMDGLQMQLRAMAAQRTNP